jgi:hypothetical protein
VLCADVDVAEGELGIVLFIDELVLFMDELLQAVSQEAKKMIVR